MPKKKKCKEAKQLSEEALHIAEKEEKLKAKEKKKAFLSKQCKKIEKNNRMGKTRDLFKKIKIPRKHFMQRWAQ